MQSLRPRVCQQDIDGVGERHDAAVHGRSVDGQLVHVRGQFRDEQSAAISPRTALRSTGSGMLASRGVDDNTAAPVPAMSVDRVQRADRVEHAAYMRCASHKENVRPWATLYVYWGSSLRIHQSFSSLRFA